MAAGLKEGSLNIAWDGIPARWVHGRHAAWLLFGVFACFSAAAGASVPRLSSANVSSLGDAVRTLSITSSDSESQPREAEPSPGKKVYTNYSVTKIPGDGRCLFRAVAHGSALGVDRRAPDESQQRELADDLRRKVADELVERRENIEWFIEGDFEAYVKRMRQPHVWGGEPELLMLSHILKKPITVFMSDQKNKKGLIAICEYGQEYGTRDPINILYHGFGHYDSLQLHDESTTPSKL